MSFKYETKGILKKEMLAYQRFAKKAQPPKKQRNPKQPKRIKLARTRAISARRQKRSQGSSAYPKILNSDKYVLPPSESDLMSRWR